MNILKWKIKNIKKIKELKTLIKIHMKKIIKKKIKIL